jgi:cytochrome c-type biogenesis protein
MKEQKPVYLVLSAPAWCYWCHVYESEDYLYHPDLYPYINEHFIAVFIDSDKRPDLTKQYLEGGWPSTTIFTPDMKRISGFSGPGDHNALKEYLVKVIAYIKDKTFSKRAGQVSYRKLPVIIPDQDNLDKAENMFLDHLITTYDTKFGGFSQGRMGQKFPNGFVYKFLLEMYEENRNVDYLNMIRNTFRNQYTEISDMKDTYRLFDPVEGGFHRYSTKEDWTVPHYEKLLGDQAKILRAYAHLLKIDNDQKVRHAVESSVSYITSRLYDKKGAFYSSQDAYLEDGYYGLSEAERQKISPPYIDGTRIMDANSMMISTLLYMYDVFRNKDDRDVALNSLSFIEREMIGEEGAYYFFDYDKNRAFLTGQSISNAWALLAFLDGYDVLGEKNHLETALNIAEYSLKNLYDWNSGAFFKRNSKDIEHFALYEHVDLTKSYEVNAVFSYAMLRLYLKTEDLTYLDSGIKTLGFLLSSSPAGIDEMYYMIRASKLVRNKDLLTEYYQKKDKVRVIVEQGKSDFFLTKLFIENRDENTDEFPKLKDDMTDSGFLILAGLAFFAGLLSFISPCTLPILPAYFAQSINTGKGEILKNTIFFFLGLATVFSIFGMGASYAGSVLRENRLIVTQVIAVFIIVFGLLEIFGKGFSGLSLQVKGMNRTPVGSFLFGSVFAIGWSACIGPILASLLLISAASVTIVKGTSLLFIYAAGLAVPLIIFSLFFDRISNKRLWKILRGRELSIHLFEREVNIHSTNLISGVTIIILGLLIFNDYLFKLNQFTFQSDYVQEFLFKGEEYLKDIFIGK